MVIFQVVLIAPQLPKLR